jgi:hypothetical protein
MHLSKNVPGSLVLYNFIFCKNVPYLHKNVPYLHNLSLLRAKLAENPLFCYSNAVASRY